MLEKRLFSVGSYEFCTRHLLIIAILSMSFTISALIRSQPAEYGLELNEYDPFFNYRATEFLVENGVDEYDAWHDELSWHPSGRNVSRTSQFMQHWTAAVLYDVFGSGSDLKDFVVVLPLILGSLTAITIFALVRVIAGTTAGLFASLFYAVSLPIIMRGTIGWFKSEPIGLFYGIIGIYLFLSGITCVRKKEAALRIAGAGIVMSLALSAWGGTQFFIIPIGLFIMTLPFLRRDHSFLIWAVPLFSIILLVSTLGFVRPGANFVFGLGGLSLGVPTVVMVICILIWRISAKSGHGSRNSLLVIFATIVTAISILAVNSVTDYLDLPDFRYIHSIYPFLTSTDPLTSSISEHATSTPYNLFFSMSTLMIFAGIGAWLLLSRRKTLDLYGLPLRNDMIVYAIIMSFAGVYTASSFVRLMLFSSLAVTVMAAIGIAILASLIFSHKGTKASAKYAFVSIVVVMLAIPLVVPADHNWVVQASVPPTLYVGNIVTGVVTDDWTEALEWIRTETPPDSVILSWWDYGYWIEALGNRATLVDNLTKSSTRIQQVAQIFYTNPNDAWVNMNDMGVDYVLVYVSARNVGSTAQPYYILDGGGDELKKVWIARIAQIDETEYVHADSVSPKAKFNETILGQMIPFSHVEYAHPPTGLKSIKWQPGFSAIYEKEIKLPANGDGPLRLVYSSPTFRDDAGTISSVLVYELNKDYVSEPVPTYVAELGVIPFLNDD